MDMDMDMNITPAARAKALLVPTEDGGITVRAGKEDAFYTIPCEMVGDARIFFAGRGVDSLIIVVR